MADAPKRTMMAQQALALSDLLNLRFQNGWVGNDPPKHIVVQAPEETTEGGKKARQAITLAPANGPAGTIMVGWLDVAQRKAELRTHAVVSQQYQQRYHRAFDVPRDAYDTTMREVQTLVSMQGIAVTVEEAPQARPLTSSRPPAPKGTSPVVLVTIAIVFIAAMGAAAFVLLR